MRLCLCFMTSSLPLVVAIYVLAIRVHLSVGFVLHAFSSDASAHDNRPPRLRRILLSQNGGKIVKTPCSAGVPTISRSTLQLAASSGSEEDILLTFKPSGVEVSCKPGEVALEVAERCSAMVENPQTPFCRNGGCYNCEVEVVEAAELGLDDNLIRSCLFQVPMGAKRLTLIQMTSDEAFEDMI